MACSGCKKVGTIVKGFGHVLTGRNKELGSERLIICKACPEYKHGVCKLCGCWVKAKTRIESEECPKLLWESV